MNNDSFGGYGSIAVSNKDYPKLSGFDGTFRVPVRDRELPLVPEHIRTATADALRVLDEDGRVLNYTANIEDGRKVQARYFTNPQDKSDGVKIEFVYPSIGGVFKSISFERNAKAKNQLELSIVLAMGERNAVVNLRADDTFTKNLMERLMGEVTLGETIKLVPYKIEKENKPGKFNRGIALHVLRNGDAVKIVSPFSAEGPRNKEMPKPVRDWDSMTDREKDNWGYDVLEFLQKEISAKFGTIVSADTSSANVDAEFAAL